MRWFWIDRFTQFDSGKAATAIKNVSLAEDHLHDHFPGVPIMPNALIVEGLAQTAGLLVGEYSGFESRVVLAKLGQARFYFPAVPGDTLEYRMTIDDIHDQGAIVSGTSQIGGRLQGEVQIVFAHLPETAAGKSLFDRGEFLAMLKLLGVFAVGRDSEGRPLAVPPSLAASQPAGQAPSGAP